MLSDFRLHFCRDICRGIALSFDNLRHLVWCRGSSLRAAAEQSPQDLSPAAGSHPWQRPQLRLRTFLRLWGLRTKSGGDSKLLRDAELARAGETFATPPSAQQPTVSAGPERSKVLVELLRGCPAQFDNRGFCFGLTGAVCKHIQHRRLCRPLYPLPAPSPAGFWGREPPAGVLRSTAGTGPGRQAAGWVPALPRLSQLVLGPGWGRSRPCWRGITLLAPAVGYGWDFGAEALAGPCWSTWLV